MAVPETHEDQDDINDQLQGPEVAEDNVPPLEQQAAPHIIQTGKDIDENRGIWDFFLTKGDCVTWAHSSMQTVRELCECCR